MGRADWESEYAAFFHANALRLRRVAWGACGDWHQAEDIVQTAFVRLDRSSRRSRTPTRWPTRGGSSSTSA